MHILVVEDERALCETIVQSLRRLAYSVDFCFDGNVALELLESERFDLIVLDLNLPGADGMTVLRTLRKYDRETRVLILSARSEVTDKVAGLDAGANDYLAKPFHLAELEARIRSLTLDSSRSMRFCSPAENSLLTVRREACVSPIHRLHSPRKNSVSSNISYSTGDVRSVRRNYWTMSWDSNADRFSNSIRVHISTLRKKLRAALGCDPIVNRIGEGYVLTEAAE